jgi:uncharacterized protein YfiM (DUF2279 family)
MRCPAAALIGLTRDLRRRLRYGQNVMGRIMALSVALALTASEATANDAWWGQDKALHLGAGLAIGSGCYGTLTLVGDDSAALRALLCATLGQLPGLGKEIYDSGRPKNAFSPKDLLWTTVGVLVSTLAMYLVERIGAAERAPTLAQPQSSPSF